MDILDDMGLSKLSEKVLKWKVLKFSLLYYDQKSEYSTILLGKQQPNGLCIILDN